jgi:hypothetical protein
VASDGSPFDAILDAIKTKRSRQSEQWFYIEGAVQYRFRAPQWKYMDGEQAFLWACGRKIPKSQLAHIPLDTEPLVGSTGDIYDDDYWRWVMYRKPVTGLKRIEELSRRLEQEAERERR